MKNRPKIVAQAMGDARQGGQIAPDGMTEAVKPTIVPPTKISLGNISFSLVWLIQGLAPGGVIFRPGQDAPPAS